MTRNAQSGPLVAFIPTLDLDTLVETAVAFANTDGGTLLIGLGDGVPLEAVSEALRLAGEQCTPALVFDGQEQIVTDYGPAIMVRVPRSSKVHALADGRVPVRAATTNRILDGREIRQLVSAKANGEFEGEIVPSATPDDLSPDLVAEFMQQQARLFPDLAAANPDDLLIQVGAVLPDGRVTVAGMLLFGRKPQQWLPDSGARLVRYVGKSRSRAHVVFEQPVSGALVPQIEQLWDLIRAQMRTDSDHPDQTEYPPAVVREALINAMLHRDYRLRRRSIEVRMFSDRLEVTSPGGLPGFLTADHLANGHFSRNPRLACALLHWGYVEEPGLGIQRMFEVMVQQGYHPPQFEVQPYTVTVRLYNERIAPTEPDVTPLNVRQRAALDHVKQYGSITFHEYCALHVRVRPDLLQQDLRELVAQGWLRKIGSRASVCYILP